MNAARKPRLGLLGVGWIGRNRMEALLQADAAEIVAIADPTPDMARAAHALAPRATLVDSLAALLDNDVDGVVIATPSALHADQAILALRKGAAVFCQKPLGRNVGETRAVVEAARDADRLLCVDFSYRSTRAMQQIRNLVREGAIGDVYAADFVFHNAYGPDKPWFYDRALSGGGCVMDLGVHLIDLCLWVLGPRRITNVDARLFVQGKPWSSAVQDVEDYATAHFDLDRRAAVSLACSWHLNLGQDAAIKATFRGTKGGLHFRNVAGSFYDFTAELVSGRSRSMLSAPPDDWGGRAVVDWAGRIARGARFDPEAYELVAVSAILDRIYQALGRRDGHAGS